MSKKTKRTVGWVAFYIFVAAFVVLLLLPFIWQFLTSVKPLNEIAEMPAKWIPSYFHGQFYVNVFTKHPFARFYSSIACLKNRAAAINSRCE